MSLSAFLAIRAAASLLSYRSLPVCSRLPKAASASTAKRSTVRARIVVLFSSHHRCCRGYRQQTISCSRSGRRIRNSVRLRARSTFAAIWNSPVCPMLPICFRPSCRWGRSSVFRSRGRYRSMPGSCCSTSRSECSTHSRDSTCRTLCSMCCRRRRTQSSWSLMMSTRRSIYPIELCS